jgi:hypothetical protein
VFCEPVEHSTLSNLIGMVAAEAISECPDIAAISPSLFDIVSDVLGRCLGARSKQCLKSTWMRMLSGR